MKDTRAGFVALVGLPNVGKSTLLNAFLGQKLSIVTPKPQTTWGRVLGIDSGAKHQLVFLDTPGLFPARDLFHRGMVESTHRAVDDADVVLAVVEAPGRGRNAGLRELRALLDGTSVPKVVALNKIDVVTHEEAHKAAERTKSFLGEEVFSVSARLGTGMEALHQALRTAVPRSAFLYPTDVVAMEPVRFFVAELVRETVIELFYEEVPYSVCSRVEQFREDGDPVYVEVILYVERRSQKGIVIGAGGKAIRRLGSASRKKIERFIGRRVYLDLRVKVLSGWRRKRGHLRRLGFAVPREEGEGDR